MVKKSPLPSNLGYDAVNRALAAHFSLAGWCSSVVNGLDTSKQESSISRNVASDSELQDPTTTWIDWLNDADMLTYLHPNITTFYLQKWNGNGSQETLHQVLFTA